MVDDLTFDNLNEIKIDAKRIRYFGGKGYITIVKNDNNFLMNYSFSGGRPDVSRIEEDVKVNNEKVLDFIKVITQPLVKKSEVFNIKLISEWIDFYSKIKRLKYDLKINDFLYEKLQSNSYMQKRLTDVLWRRGFGCTNNYPRLKIVVKYDKAKKIEITSNEQRDFMVPWVINYGETVVTTANIKISQTIFELMPDGFTNSDKLLGDEFMIERLELKV